VSALSTLYASTTLSGLEEPASTSTSLPGSISVSTTLRPVYLIVDVITPRPGAKASSVHDIRLRIRYSDDGLIPDQNLTVAIGRDNVFLVRVGDFFVGAYSPPVNMSAMNISVLDARGYFGRADIALVPDSAVVSSKEINAIRYLGLIAAGIFLVFVLPILVIQHFRKSRNDPYRKGQYSEVKNMIDTMNKKTEDERISRWVFEKLSAGEDPELLKEGLKEMGYDPSIVDRVLDNSS